MYKVYAGNELLCDSRIDELAIIDPSISLAVNSAGEFSFVMPSKHPKYDLVKMRKTIISVYRDNDQEPVFQGTAVEENIDFYKQKSIVCEGELAYLNDSILRPAKREGMTPRQLLETYIAEHNEQVEESKRFSVGSVTVSTSNTINTTTNMTDTMSQVRSDLIDDLGGYMLVRYADGKKYIDYLSMPDKVCGQKIELGKNLIDYTSNVDSEEFATVVIPLGATLETQEIEGISQRLTIKSVNSGKDYIENASAIETFGRITKVVEFDEITDAAELKEKGQQYLRDEQFDSMYIEAKAIDFGYLSEKFEKFKLADKVQVVSSVHGIDKYFMLAQMDIKLNNPEQDVFTFIPTTASRTVSSKKLSQQVNSTEEIEEIDESVGNLEISLKKTEEGLLSEVIRATQKEGELGTKISQTAHSIALVATGGENSVGITIRLYDENGNLIDSDNDNANITIKGAVTFEDLSGAGKSTINGANIATGSISADKIKAGAITAGRVQTSDGKTIIDSGQFIVTGGQIQVQNSSGGKVSNIQATQITTPTLHASTSVYSEGTVYADKGISVGANQQISSYNFSASHTYYIPNYSSLSTSSNKQAAINPNGAIVPYSGSSENFKHGIRRLKTYDANKLYELDVDEFIYNEDYLDKEDDWSKKVVPGFIAEKMEKVMPIAVLHDKEGNPIDWKEKAIVPLLLKLIQEQNERIEKLEKGKEL